MAAITVYIDDSGSDPNQEVAVASCLIAPIQRWKRLERQWYSALHEFGIRDFHTSECVARNHKSEYASWQLSTVDAALKRFRYITKENCVISKGFSFHKRDFLSLVPEDLRDFFGGNHFCWAIFGLLGMVQSWRESEGIKEDFEYVFDYTTDKDTKKRIDRVFDCREYEDFFHRKYGIRAGLYSFRYRKDLPQLQATDLMAWTCYQRTRHALGYKASETAKRSWNDFYAHKNGEFVELGTPNETHITNWVNRTRLSRKMREIQDKQTSKS